MINGLTCFKCWQSTAILTYEENKIYKVSCECGCSYDFEHSSMKCAVDYHNKMLELYGEIDKNLFLKAEIQSMKSELERVRAERNALEELLKMSVGACEHCKFSDDDGNSNGASDFCNSCTENENPNWQWCGLEGNHEQN